MERGKKGKVVIRLARYQLSGASPGGGTGVGSAFQRGAGSERGGGATRDGDLSGSR